MHILFAEYLNRLRALHADIQKAIDDLPHEALDWIAGPEMNSLAVLAVHVAGAARYWIGDVAGQDPSGRDRAAEFRTKGVEAAALKSRLDAALSHSQSILEKLTLSDLDAPRVARRDGQTHTVAEALLHALEHTAIHLGHIQIVRQLWEQHDSSR